MEQPIPLWPGREAGPVYVRSTPEGPAEQAVFVHGLAGSATNWTDLMGELADLVTGHAIDLPGNGYSPAPPDGDYSITAHARAVIGLMEQTGPAHLFGNSLGGAVSVRAAALRPDLVRSLTLVSPALPDWYPRYGPVRVFAAAAPRLGELGAALLGRLPAERRIAASLAMVYADPAVVHPERVRAAVEELRRRDGLPYSAAAMIGSTRGIVREYLKNTLWREAATITAPTLLLYGRHDRLVRAAMARKAARSFPNARLVLLPHCGHCAQMEAPKVVAAEARRLILETRLGNAPLAS
ncbi:alpha/beta hydrolase [Nonomuraea sp. NPDC050310]|uniref:alpha/beta fold hydrolase n=1 Tax=unclassified Nonomuraea TaxID=2593643 RepID=UPI0033EC67A9